MHNNNENVHLWMLEQDRQKNRELTIEQAKTRHAPEDLPHIPDYLIRGSQETSKDEGEKLAKVEIQDIDQLIREKEGLEEESKRLDEEKEQLIHRTRVLLEGAILDLKKTNSEKQQEVNKLKARLVNIKSQPRQPL